tara:strand:+ start:34 stop:186 length:153 start_codon:yes stop_codon:yes gene_type:complete
VVVEVVVKEGLQLVEHQVVLVVDRIQDVIVEVTPVVLLVVVVILPQCLHL